MTRAVAASAGGFDELTVVLVLMDLAAFTAAVRDLPAADIAIVLDRFHRTAGRRVAEHGGRVVKFSGDNCLAMFDAADAPRAVGCALRTREDVIAAGRASGLALDLGANVHLSTVAAGVFGEPPAAAFDVAGIGVVHTYRLGSGAGIRLSEPVYRKLPSAERSVWRKHQPPAVYRFEP